MATKISPEGTIVDILKATGITPARRINLACYVDLVDEKTLRLFAVWCARRALAATRGEPVARLVECVDVAEKYAHGAASEADLKAAQEAARGAARGAAYDGAWNAVWSAAVLPARSAAWLTAREVSWLAGHAVRTKFARKRALVAEEQAQIAQLILLIEATMGGAERE